MTRKIIISAMGVVLLIAVPILSGFAAEKAKDKKETEKAEQQAKTGEMLKHRENLLDQLVKAYEQDDKKAMGEIIKKMQQRREKMQKLAKLSRWHRMEHRRMGGFGRGCGMQGGLAPGWQGRCPMGMRNRQRFNFDDRPMPGWQGLRQGQGWIPQAPDADELQAADLEPDAQPEDEILPEQDLPDVGIADLFWETDW